MCPDLLNPKPVESQVMFLSPQNISGASRRSSAATFTETTEVDGDPRGPKIPYWFSKDAIYTFCKPTSSL